MIPAGDHAHVTCRDCRATRCDESCPSAQAADHELVLAEIDAWNDHAAQTYRERWSA